MAPNLDMLAYDMADMLDRNGYSHGEWSEDDIRPHLADFLARVAATAAQAGDEPGPDAMRSTPEPEPTPVHHMQRKLGRVHVFTTFTCQVFWIGEAVEGVSEVSVTDWHKHGSAWALEQLQAHVAQRADGREFWLSRAERSQVRVRPFAGERVDIPVEVEPWSN